MPSLDERLTLIGDALERGAVRSADRRHRRRRAMRLGAVATVALTVAVASAVAANSLLGTPAPADVQKTIDDYYPPDHGDTMAPAPGGSTVVATFGNDVLYRLRPRVGTNICLGIVLADRPGGQRIPGEGCTAPLGGPSAWLPIGIVLEQSGEALVQPTGVRELIFGQLHAPAGSTLWIEPQGEAPQQISTGLDGFFLIERTLSPRAAGERDPAAYAYQPARFVLRDASGTQTESRTIPFLRPGSPITP